MCICLAQLIGLLINACIMHIQKVTEVQNWLERELNEIDKEITDTMNQ